MVQYDLVVLMVCLLLSFVGETTPSQGDIDPSLVTQVMLPNKPADIIREACKQVKVAAWFKRRVEDLQVEWCSVAVLVATGSHVEKRLFGDKKRCDVFALTEEEGPINSFI